MEAVVKELEMWQKNCISIIHQLFKFESDLKTKKRINMWTFELKENQESRGYEVYFVLLFHNKN